MDQAFSGTITQWTKYDFINFISEAQDLHQWWKPHSHRREGWCANTSLWHGVHLFYLPRLSCPWGTRYHLRFRIFMTSARIEMATPKEDSEFGSRTIWCRSHPATVIWSIEEGSKLPIPILPQKTELERRGGEEIWHKIMFILADWLKVDIESQMNWSKLRVLNLRNQFPVFSNKMAY